MNSGHGRLVVTVTSSGPVAVTVPMSFSAAPISVLLRYSSKFRTRAAASSGVPSWNLMPSRSVIFHSVKSALGSTDFARYGTISFLVFGTMSVS